jgi:hypothetical protein
MIPVGDILYREAFHSLEEYEESKMILLMMKDLYENISKLR